MEVDTLYSLSQQCLHSKLEETEEKVEGDRYEEDDETANFLWVAVRTVVVVEDSPEAEAA